ncbi:hypothetical protein GA0115253_101415 [Streptomyces sp. Termitarium-T10T-6]|nr:hypothetical protein GA0115253_101415 [Streptomyces sp. Termitarium-T10T-6]
MCCARYADGSLGVGAGRGLLALPGGDAGAGRGFAGAGVAGVRRGGLRRLGRGLASGSGGRRGGVGPVVGFSPPVPLPGSWLVALPSPPSVAGADPVPSPGVGDCSSAPPSLPVSPEGAGSAGPESRSPPPRTTELRVVPWPPLRSLPEISSNAVIPAMETAKTAAAASAGRFQPRSRVPWVTPSPNASSGTAARSAPASGSICVRSSARGIICVRSASAPAPRAPGPPAGGTRSIRVRSSPRFSSCVRSVSTGLSSCVLSASGTTRGTVPGPTVGSTVVASSAGRGPAGSGSVRCAAALRPAGVVSLVCTVTWRPSGWVTWTVTSRICSPVRRKKCWKTEPPQVATTLITPAPAIVPYTPNCEASTAAATAATALPATCGRLRSMRLSLGSTSLSGF